MPEEKKKAKKVKAPEPEQDGAKAKEKPKAVEKKAEKKFKPRSKPEITPEEKVALELRACKKDKTPVFKRQEWFRYQKLGDKWRKPRGLHSKMRRHINYRINVVSIGYRGPKSVRGKHPSGFEDVLIHNTKEMEGLDSKRQAIRIGHSVGYLKRMHIAIRAEELNLRILNFSRETHEELLAEAKKRGIGTPQKQSSSKEGKQ